MKPHLFYLSYVLRHKWWVLVAGIRLGPPSGWPMLRHLRWWLQLLVHDLSKFRPSEWAPYVDYFYGPPVEGCPKCKEERQAAFDVAWLHHQHRNLHHWQRWLLRLDKPASDWGWTMGYHVFLLNGPQGSRFWLGTRSEDPDVLPDSREVERLATLLNSHSHALPMPERYAREMVADWMGAGRAITGEWKTPKWYWENRHNMVLHPDTRAYVESELGISFVPDGRALVPVVDFF